MNSFDMPSDTPRLPLWQALGAYEGHARAHLARNTAYHSLRRIREFLNWLPPEVGRLDEVTPSLVSRFLEFQTTVRGLKPTTVLNSRMTLSAFFSHAVQLQLLAENPVTSVRLPKLADRDIRWLRREQFEELLLRVKGRPWAPLIPLLLFAGLRLSEGLWLTWDDVDEERRLLRIRSKVVNGEEWRTKTRRNRNVPIAPRLFEHLQALPRRATWVVPTARGNRFDLCNLETSWRRVLRPKDENEKLLPGALPWTFGDMRHTAASHWARGGMSIFKIALLLGNSVKVTQAFYAALLPEELGNEIAF